MTPNFLFNQIIPVIMGFAVTSIMVLDTPEAARRSAVSRTNFYGAGRTGEIAFATWKLGHWDNTWRHFKLLWGQIKVKNQKGAVFLSAFGDKPWLRDWYYGMGSYFGRANGGSPARVDVGGTVASHVQCHQCLVISVIFQCFLFCRDWRSVDLSFYD